jgi:hypothetical protein
MRTSESEAVVVVLLVVVARAFAAGSHSSQCRAVCMYVRACHVSKQTRRVRIQNSKYLCVGVRVISIQFQSKKR